MRAGSTERVVGNIWSAIHRPEILAPMAADKHSEASVPGTGGTRPLLRVNIGYVIMKHTRSGKSHRSGTPCVWHCSALCRRWPSHMSRFGQLWQQCELCKCIRLLQCFGGNYASCRNSYPVWWKHRCPTLLSCLTDILVGGASLYIRLICCHHVPHCFRK